MYCARGKGSGGYQRCFTLGTNTHNDGKWAPFGNTNGETIADLTCLTGDCKIYIWSRELYRLILSQHFESYHIGDLRGKGYFTREYKPAGSNLNLALTNG